MSHGFEITECKACHARIFFAPTAKKKLIPLLEAPSPKGNIMIRDGIAVYKSKANPVKKDETLYLSHFADCPDAGQFRTPKEPG